MTKFEPGPAYDVVIVGAGPAGLAAASVTARAGLATLLVDENASLGGQIYRAITTTPVAKRHILGSEYWHGLSLVAEARASGAEIIQSATVWSIDRDRQVGISHEGRSRFVSARRVVIATGAMERPFPIPGWTLPGVMTAGAAQTLLKSSGLVPSGRVVLAGTGPLLWLLAAQLLRAGGSIDPILDTTAADSSRRALPHAIGFLLSPLVAKGLALKREVSRQVRVIKHVTTLAAEGSARVERIAFATKGGQMQQLPVDQLLLHQGIVPNTNLAMSAGVTHRWSSRQLCWVPQLDAHGRSSIPGLFLAGDGAGIAGGLAAEARGRICGLAVASDLAPHRPVDNAQPIEQQLAREERARPFLDIMFTPPPQFRIPDGNTIVCRCEEVTSGQVSEAVRLGCTGPNQLKAFLRCGMGPCQGRLCGLTVSELIARDRATTPADVGHLRLRPPIKPITLGELADLPVAATAVKAVVRG